MPILIIKFNHTNLILSGHTMSLEIQVNVRICDFKVRLKQNFIYKRDKIRNSKKQVICWLGRTAKPISDYITIKWLERVYR